MNIHIKNNLKSSLSREVLSYFEKNKKRLTEVLHKVLGKKYELSFALIGKKISKEINHRYRDKDKPTDILSFPINKSSGEILINPESALKKSKEHDMNLEKYLIFLVIHGILHLKGMDHGSKMEESEKRLMKFFN